MANKLATISSLRHASEPNADRGKGETPPADGQPCGTTVGARGIRREGRSIVGEWVDGIHNDLIELYLFLLPCLMPLLLIHRFATRRDCGPNKGCRKYGDGFDITLDLL